MENVSDDDDDNNDDPSGDCSSLSLCFEDCVAATEKFAVKL